jgi:hypothetical protein
MAKRWPYYSDEIKKGLLTEIQMGKKEIELSEAAEHGLKVARDALAAMKKDEENSNEKHRQLHKESAKVVVQKQEQPETAEIYGLHGDNLPSIQGKHKEEGTYIFKSDDLFVKRPVLFYPDSFALPQKFWNKGGNRGLWYHDLRQLFGKDTKVEEYMVFAVANNEILQTGFVPIPGSSDPEQNKAVKADDGKNPLDLLPTKALESVGLVLEHGAKKYAAHNWRKGMKWSRLISALLRHVFAFMRGENTDPESGLPHMAHAGCCVLFLLDYQLTSVGEDDRYKE